MRSIEITLTRRLALAAAALSAAASLALLPLALAKPGRIQLVGDGQIALGSISLRGIGVLLAADIAMVIAIHLALTLRRPRASLFPVGPALTILGGSGWIMAALGAWLLADQDGPWGGSNDLAGAAAGSIALLSLALFRREYARFWTEASGGGPPPERPQTLPERPYHGFFMGLIAGAIAGTFAAIAAVALAHLLGSPLTHRVIYIVGAGAPVSITVQVVMVGFGLRGKIGRSDQQ